MTMHVRRWCVTDVSCAEHLAVALTGQTWCGCTGFRFGGYLWLNDATSPDGAQEFAVVRIRDHAQVESVTFGWVDATRGSRSSTRSSPGWDVTPPHPTDASIPH